jgi:hypothetical protein
MKDCLHYKELIKHINHESPYRPVVVHIINEYYIIDMMVFEPIISFKLFKIDMDKFELIENSGVIFELVGNKNPKYITLHELYKIFIQNKRKNKIDSLYE